MLPRFVGMLGITRDKIGRSRLIRVGREGKSKRCKL